MISFMMLAADYVLHYDFAGYLVFTGAVGGFTCIIYCYVFSNYLVRSATSYYVMLSIFQFVGKKEKIHLLKKISAVI